MLDSSAAPRRRAPLVALLSALLAGAALVLTAAPASAHDALVSSDPTAGAALSALPAKITLTYSDDVLADAGATQVQVIDAAGTSLVSGAPVVAGPDVSQALAGVASGEITVVWRVVSSDGHPISGQFSFTVPSAPTTTATPEPTGSPSAAATTAPTTTDAAAPPSETAAAPSALPWILPAVIVVAVVAAVVWLLVGRGRRTPPRDGSSTGTGR